MIQLVRRAKKKDDQAFIELIDRCKGDLYKVARSYLNNEEDIADAIQETVIDCYEKIGSLREAKYFKTWLTRILINNCNDILRCGRRDSPLEEAAQIRGESRELERCEFEEVLDALDEKYRIILVLYYGEGFKIREIAQILELEVNTVKSRLSRGRKQFEHMYCMEPSMQRG